MKPSEKLILIQRLSALTQERLAEKLSVSFVTLNSWINDRSNPRAKKQVLIDELYATYTGTRIIPETVLSAKKDILLTKSKKHKNILSIIIDSPDIYDQFVLSLTYNTNSIEGSTLTESETADIIFKNASLPNKSLIEHLEAKNHQTALKYLFEHIDKKKPLTEDFILRLHAILMNSIREDAGYYRNHGVRIVGANIPTANFLKIPALMKNLLRSIHRKNRDIIAHTSTIHSDFEQIHPFSDGNGRIGRLLIHAMLVQSNLPPAVIIQENKRLYMSHLNTSQRNGDTTLLQDFLCDAALLGFDIIEKR